MDDNYPSAKTKEEWSRLAIQKAMALRDIRILCEPVASSWCVDPGEHKLACDILKIIKKDADAI